MPFRFRFKSLLQKREHSLQEAQSALAAALHRWGEIKRSLEMGRKDYQQAWREWQEQQGRGIEAKHFMIHINYLKHLERQLLILEDELNESHKEVERRKSTVLQRDMELKILQELKKKDMSSYHHAQLKKEQAQLDEVAIFKDFHCRSF